MVLDVLNRHLRAVLCGLGFAVLLGGSAVAGTVQGALGALESVAPALEGTPANTSPSSPKLPSPAPSAPTPEPSSASASPPASAGGVLFADDFATMDPGWGKASANQFVQGGQFVLVANPGRAQWVLNAGAHARQAGAGDRIQVDVAQDPPESGSKNLAYAALIFWASDLNNLYEFEITKTGFAVASFSAGKETTLTPWQQTAALKTQDGAVNEIAVLDTGNGAKLFINGQVVGTLPPQLISAFADRIGFDCGASDHIKNTCRFFNLKIVAPSAATNASLALSPGLRQPLQAANWPVLFSDDFTKRQSYWFDDRPKATIRDGHLSLTGTANGENEIIPDGLDYRSKTNTADISVDLGVTGKGGDGGILFWAKNDKNEFAFIVSHGGFNVSGYENDKLTSLVPGKISDAVRTGPGAVNHLEVVDRGDIAYFRINGQTVAHAAAPPSGTGDVVGLVCQGGERNAATCDFSNFEITAPPSVSEAAPNPPPAPPPNPPPKPKVIFADDFTSLKTVWVGAKPAASVADGQLTLTVPTKGVNEVAASGIDYRKQAPHAVIQVGLSQSTDADYGGVVFWSSGVLDEYNFVVRGDAFSVGSYKDGLFTSLIDWTRSAALKQGPDAVNRLAVLDAGGTAYFLINGALVGRVAAPAQKPGATGVGDGFGLVCHSPGPAVNCRFSHLSVTTPGPDIQTALPPGAVIYADSFDTLAPGWGPAGDHTRVQGGALLLDAKADGWQAATASDLHYRQVSDSAEISARVSRSGVDSTAGLLFWVENTDNEYELLVGDDTFAVGANRNGAFVKLIDVTHTAALNNGDGAINQIAVVDEGTFADILINGQHVGQIKAPQSHADGVGFDCVAGKAAPARCSFADLQATVPTRGVMQPPSPGTVIYADDFVNMRPGWGSPSPSYYVAGGHYVLDFDHGGGQNLNRDLNYEAATREADIRVDADHSTRASAVGLVFWARDPDNNYTFLISGDQFGVFKVVGGDSQTAIGWRQSVAINAATGATNRLDVIDDRDEAELLINGRRVGSVDAPAVPPGDHVGFDCETNGRPARCRFSHFIVSVPEPASPTGDSASMLP
jgi:hypothetical protein